MTNSILISKVIFKALNDNTDITNICKEKIYPLIVDADVTFPFIVFRRGDIQPVGTKDGYNEDVVYFEIATASSSYFQSLEIANYIRQTFEDKEIISCGLCLDNTSLDDISESYDDNCFIQRLSFKTSVTNYI